MAKDPNFKFYPDNQSQQVSAYDKAVKDPKFLPWLHELTHLGYNKGITVESDHGECVGFLFIEGKTPEQALPEYEEFKRRWNAINQK